MVLNEADVFVSGEVKLGQYQVTILRYMAGGWVPTVPPLEALVTNYRLILHPQTRRPHPPASIPSVYITKILDIELNQRPAVQICLKTGHQLSMFASWSQGINFMESVKTMITSPAGNHFKHQPAERDINRLIEFIQQL